MHIAFLIPTLSAGGAERVATLLCNYWAERGHRIDLLTFEQPGTEPFFAVQGVTLHRLDCMNESGGLAATFLANSKRMLRLRSFLKRCRPDVIVTFMTEANVAALSASLGLGIPVVVSERNQPERRGLLRSHRLARRVSYPFATAIVVQTSAIAAWMRTRFRVPVLVFPNPVSAMGNGVAKPRDRCEATQICAVGRLTEQKGFDLLIESFARVAGKHHDCRVAIYGEGPLRADLEAKIAQHDLQGRVKLQGLTKDIRKALSESSLFVLPSRYEGYPNALIEALAAGLPVIAADCPGGIAEILDRGRYGMLVPAENVSALTEALDTLLSDETLREAFAIRAHEAVAKLDLALVGDDWLAALTKILEERGGYGTRRWRTRRSKESYS